MKKGIQTRHQINAPIESVWSHIATGAQWENWLPILSGSKVSGNTRTCNLFGPDGHEDVLQESFLASNLEKTFIYQINQQQSFPATDIVGYMKLEGDEKATTLHWSVEKSVKSEEDFANIQTQISFIYTEAAKQLEALAADKLLA